MPSDPEAVRRKKRRRRRRRGAPWYVWVIVLAVLLGGAAAVLTHFFVFVGGAIYSRDEEFLDLRQEKLSAASYEALREKLPHCEILWSVPIGDGSYDSRTEDLVLAAFRDGDEALFAYFPDLRSVDATPAALTPAQFEAIRAALPGKPVRWSVPIGQGRYPSDSVSIQVGDFSEAEIPAFRYFDALEEVDARSAVTYDAILALREAMPELTVLWRVPFSGADYPQDAEEITVTDASLTAGDLDNALALLPAVRVVSMPECPWTEAEKTALAEKYPAVDFRWTTEVLGEKFTSDTETMSFAGRSLSEADAAELTEKLGHFPALKSVDLAGCGLTADQLLPLQEAFPDVELNFDFDLLGVKVNTSDTLIDLSGIPMESAEPVERILPFMHRLEKVDMCDCGLSDEEMDALNKRHEQTQFVWMLHIVYYKIRTDAVAFRATSNHYSDFDESSQMRLQYCENMVALDLGHRNITTLEFVRNMPDLKYLVMMSNRIPDLSPLSTCKNLVWVELNHSWATSDITPLKDCTGLRDLNITDMPLDSDSATETLCAMPWLERLWYSAPEFSDAQVAAIQEANPDLYMQAVPSWANSCMNPWRYDQDYYDMRDVMNMFYMDETGRINYKIIDGVRYELDPEFIANQGDTSHDKDRG